MKCPVCPAVDLVMTERRGIEIDYCPKCRGVWLDRGELDKLIERSSEPDEQYGVTAVHPPPHNHQPTPNKDLDDSKYGYQYRKPKKWWHEIFD
jgi:Zn-finger nucleic acid-binding protein